MKDFIAEAEQQLNTAINSDNDNEEWRLAKNMRNRTTKIIEKSKKIYYESILQNSRDLWQTLKQITNTNKITIPRRIVHNGEVLTSPKKIANALNKN